MKHKIEITEILQRVIEVEAENEDEAIILIKRAYQNENIVLDSSDYVRTKIEVFA